MMALWGWFVSTTVGRWIVGAGAMLAALAGVALTFFIKGKHAQAKTDEAKDAQSLADAAQAALNAANTRMEIDNENAKLPDAPAQSVATADPSTAAGKLRTDGWVRDDTKPPG